MDYNRNYKPAIINLLIITYKLLDYKLDTYKLYTCWLSPELQIYCWTSLKILKPWFNCIMTIAIDLMSYSSILDITIY
jgi:hypothetical protein